MRETRPATSHGSVPLTRGLDIEATFEERAKRKRTS
jgi:hypothetical protein